MYLQIFFLFLLIKKNYCLLYEKLGTFERHPQSFCSLYNESHHKLPKFGCAIKCLEAKELCVGFCGDDKLKECTVYNIPTNNDQEKVIGYSSYYYTSERRNFDDALKFCENMGASLYFPQGVHLSEIIEPFRAIYVPAKWQNNAVYQIYTGEIINGTNLEPDDRYENTTNVCISFGRRGRRFGRSNCENIRNFICQTPDPNLCSHELVKQNQNIYNNCYRKLLNETA